MIPNSMSEQKIREHAYAIWQSEGCPHGRDLDHWLAAERQIMSVPPELATGQRSPMAGRTMKSETRRAASMSSKAPVAAKRSTSRAQARKAPSTNPRKKT